MERTDVCAFPETLDELNDETSALLACKTERGKVCTFVFVEQNFDRLGALNQRRLDGEPKLSPLM